MLNHDVLPKWGNRRIQDITRRDVIELLDGLTDRGLGIGANRSFALVRKLFNWAVERDIIAETPCKGIRPPVSEVSRDRLLSDDEIKAFWKATEAIGYPFGPLFRLLLLTGQRLGEVAEMSASELRPDERMWTIPKERAKNNSVHDVPLSDAALAVLEALPRIAGTRRFLFTTTTETAVSGFSKSKEGLDRIMAPTTPWRLHDLRRTVASGMARLGINLPVIEKVLNHTSGSFAGIVGVYQRHSFADEKRQALEAWGRFVTALVEDRPAKNIIELRR